MFFKRLSLRVTLTISVLAMAALGILLGVLLTEAYRQYAIDSQSQAFEQIIGLQVSDNLDELARISHDLGQALQTDPAFRKVFRANNEELLKQHLLSQFHQYFVTAGIIKLESLALYAPDLSLLSSAYADGAQQKANCPNLHQRVRLRKGAERLKTLSELCLVNGRPYFSFILPIGGFKVKAYLEIVTDPIYSLRVLESDLGLPLQLSYVNGEIAYQSERWPAMEADYQGVVASYEPMAMTAERAFVVSVARDVSALQNRLTSARNTYVAIVSFIALLLSLITMLLLHKTTLLPLRALGAQLRSIRHDRHQLGKQISVMGNVEIRELTAGFNEMTSELKTLYDTELARNEELRREIATREQIEQELKRHRTQLEQLVEQRTLDLAMARDEALEASRVKSQFLANMSHELRTPLNAILGYGEILIEDAEALGEEGLISDLRKVNAAGKHLLSLINDILDLTRIESGKIDLYEELVDVRKVVDELADTIHPLVLENNNALEVKCQENVGEILTDLTKLRQTLLNLLSNACKFTHDGLIQLTVWREQPNGQEYLYISVRDEGVGMSQAEQDNLFETFFQADNSSTRKFGGTGLGLAISQHFCHMMGGSIHVVSAPGEGSTFTVMLPVK